jgi:hypothetical protein
MTHNSVKLLLLLMIVVFLAGCAGPELSATDPAEGALPAATVALTMSAAGSDDRFDCSSVSDLPAAECQVLVELYEATDGANWSNQAGWLDVASPCSWYGITCIDGHVDTVELSTNNLRGAVPSALGDLSVLRFMDLHNNAISGALPLEIGRLSQLVHLDLSANEISGPVPPTIGDLSALENLDLSNNALTGAIPEEIGKLAVLRNLYLSQNQFSSPIPESLGGIATLESIRLRDNQLEGGIPFGLGQLTALSEVDLSFNQLTGSAPSSLFLVPIHRLWGNSLDGTITVGEEGRQDVNFLGATFTFDKQTAESVWPELVPPREAEEGPGIRWAPSEHIEFTFVPADGPSEHAPLGLYLPPEGQIHIYPTAGLNEEVQPIVAGLRQLLVERPDLTPYETINPAQGDDHPGLTMLPPSNAQQALRAQPQYLSFAEGSGVRYLTQLSQGPEAINNQSLFYTFQGLTDDGSTYVAAYFPVSLPSLPNSPQMDEETLAEMITDWQSYLAQTLALINEQPATAFTPDLTALDALVSSISVAGTQEVPVLELIWPDSEASVDSQPILQWQTFPGADSYHVMVLDDVAYPPQVVIDQTVTDPMLPVDTPLAPGHYSWTVLAQTATAEVLAQLNSTFFVVDAIQPVAPAAAETVGAEPQLQWEGYPGATGYQVIVIDDDVFPPVVVLEQATTDTSLVVSPALEPGSYSWTVRALDNTNRVLAELNSSFIVADGS